MPRPAVLFSSFVHRMPVRSSVTVRCPLSHVAGHTVAHGVRTRGPANGMVLAGFKKLELPLNPH